MRGTAEEEEEMSDSGSKRKRRRSRMAGVATSEMACVCTAEEGEIKGDGGRKGDE